MSENNQAELRQPLSEEEKAIIEECRATLLTKGMDFKDFLVENAKVYLEKNKIMTNGRKYVTGAMLLDAVEKTFQFKPSKTDMQYYRNKNWTEGREYFALETGLQKTYSYDLAFCLTFFRKLAQKRGKRKGTGSERTGESE